jgi:hypothetical protein
MTRSTTRSTTNVGGPTKIGEESGGSAVAPAPGGPDFA